MTSFITCISGKRIYQNLTDARDAKKHIRQKYHSSQKIYECPHCGFYHLTRTKNYLRRQIKMDLFKRLITTGEVEAVECYGNGLRMYQIWYKGFMNFVGYNENDDTVKVLYKEKTNGTID